MAIHTCLVTYIYLVTYICPTKFSDVGFCPTKFKLCPTKIKSDRTNVLSSQIFICSPAIYLVEILLVMFSGLFSYSVKAVSNVLCSQPFHENGSFQETSIPPPQRKLKVRDILWVE